VTGTGRFPRAARAMLTLFRAIYLGGAALCLAAAALVTASLFMAERAPQSGTMLGISVIVSGIFLLIGILLFAVQHHAAATLSVLGHTPDQGSGALRRPVVRLLVTLGLAGALLDGFLAILTYAILARIDQGFAVFG
jgi:uncharacterized integral membrane protein